jgi:hypothetical protein
MNNTNTNFGQGTSRQEGNYFLNELPEKRALREHLREEIAESGRKDDEIRRLKEIIEELSDHGCAAERMEFIKAQGAEIERLKESKNILSDLLYKMEARANRQEGLNRRAADALEGAARMVRTSSESDLIAELRREPLD